MGLISRVSSRTYRSKKPLKMADKVKALRVSSLRNESKADLTAKLGELRQELATLKVAKVTNQSASKLGKIKVVRKDIAKVLTVINQTQKAELQKLYRGKKSQASRLKTTKNPSLEEKVEQTRRKLEKFEDRPTRTKDRFEELCFESLKMRERFLG